MPFVAAPNIVMVEVRATKAGQKIENRFTIDALTAVTPAVVADVTNVVSNWAQATYFDSLPEQVQLVETVGTDLSVHEGAQHTIVPEGTVIGALTGPSMPNEVTLCVSLRSDARGRSARGRAFVLGLSRQGVVENNVNTGYANDFVNAFTALKTAITTEGWAWVVVSYRTNNAPRPGGPVYFPITSVVVVDLVVDSMRRRKPGVGQ